MKDIMKNVQLDPAVILDLILKYPNDSELGKNIRSYYVSKVEWEKPKEKKNG